MNIDNRTYEAIFEASPDAMLIVNDGAIMMANKKCVRLFGYEKEELLGNKIELLIPARFKNVHERYMADYNAKPFEKQMGEGRDIFAKRKDGSEFPVEISLNPIELDGQTVVAAAVRDVSIRKELEAKVMEHETKFKNALDGLLEGVMILGRDWGCKYVNNAIAKHSNLSKDEMMGKTLHELFPFLEDSEIFKMYKRCFAEQRDERMESEVKFPGNASKWFDISVESIPEGLFVLTMDITDRRLSEMALAESEEQYRYLFDKNPQPMWIVDIETLQFLQVNEAAIRQYGYSREEFFKMTLTEIRPADTVDDFLKEIHLGSGGFQGGEAWQHKKKDGQTIYVNIFSQLIAYKQHKARLVLAVNVTDQKRAEEEIIRQKKFTEAVLNNIPADIAVFDKSQNYIFLNKHSINDPEVRTWLIGKNDFDYNKLKGGNDFIANNRQKLFTEAVENNKDVEWVDEHSKNGTTSYILRKLHPVFESDQLTYVIGYGIDITKPKDTELKLRGAMVEVQRANKELEQFAYMVSHDLQEPLRMVTGFLNLLKAETEAQLDQSAKEYIDYAVDGAERMKILIRDLLEYSRVGTNKDDFAETNLNEVLKYVIHVLDENIETTGAKIQVQNLPVISCNKTLITQLFMNLVSNALKYHSNKTPEIVVGSRDDKVSWLFFVKDNGIGIEPKYAEQVFVIFQRLHARNEYLGSGIGLAICKKIVEKHDGRIWVESEPGAGSTFFFTIPKK